MSLKDYMTDEQRSMIGGLPLRGNYARKYVGVARPGKTAKKRAKEAAARAARAASEAQKTA